MKFNVVKYKELLMKAESSKKTGKAYFEDPEVLELLNYKASVHLQVLYKEKTKYLELIQKYFDERIFPNEFRNKYLEISKKSMEKTDKILKNFDELSNFWIEPGKEKLSSLLDEIHEACQCIIEFGIDDAGISEDGFRNLLQKVILEMQKSD
jgi:hypothetical protein